jgi:hypothetical protein
MNVLNQRTCTLMFRNFQVVAAVTGIECKPLAKEEMMKTG